MYAAISADIVSSTSLSKDAMIELTEKLEVSYVFWKIGMKDSGVVLLEEIP